MRGLQRLIEIRRSGRKPPVLLLSMAGMSCGTVHEGELIREESDSPTSSDLRALHRLTVIVMGVPFGGFDQAEQWARAACKAGASDVALNFGTDGPVWIRRNGEDIA